MEKNKPNCPLSRVKELITHGKGELTFTASETAFQLGFSTSEVFSEVMKLKPEDFYKSMTTFADHKVWQDVYHYHSKSGMLYIKLMVQEEVLVVSFKEL